MVGKTLAFSESDLPGIRFPMTPTSLFVRHQLNGSASKARLLAATLLAAPLLWSGNASAAGLKEVYELAAQYDAEYSAA